MTRFFGVRSTFSNGNDRKLLLLGVVSGHLILASYGYGKRTGGMSRGPGLALIHGSIPLVPLLTGAGEHNLARELFAVTR